MVSGWPMITFSESAWWLELQKRKMTWANNTGIAFWEQEGPTQPWEVRALPSPWPLHLSPVHPLAWKGVFLSQIKQELSCPHILCSLEFTRQEWPWVEWCFTTCLLSPFTAGETAPNPKRTLHVLHGYQPQGTPPRWTSSWSSSMCPFQATYRPVSLTHAERNPKLGSSLRSP